MLIQWCFFIANILTTVSSLKPEYQSIFQLDPGNDFYTTSRSLRSESDDYVEKESTTRSPKTTNGSSKTLHYNKIQKENKTVSKKALSVVYPTESSKSDNVTNTIDSTKAVSIVNTKTESIQVMSAVNITEPTKSVHVTNTIDTTKEITDVNKTIVSKAVSTVNNTIDSSKYVSIVNNNTDLTIYVTDVNTAYSTNAISIENITDSANADSVENNTDSTKSVSVKNTTDSSLYVLIVNNTGLTKSGSVVNNTDSTKVDFIVSKDGSIEAVVKKQKKSKGLTIVRKDGRRAVWEIFTHAFTHQTYPYTEQHEQTAAWPARVTDDFFLPYMGASKGSSPGDWVLEEKTGAGIKEVGSTWYVWPYWRTDEPPDTFHRWCNVYHQRLGVVCGYRLDQVKYTYQFRTFKDWCELEYANYGSLWQRYSWSVLHTGMCDMDNAFYPNTWSSQDGYWSQSSFDDLLAKADVADSEMRRVKYYHYVIIKNEPVDPDENGENTFAEPGSQMDTEFVNIKSEIDGESSSILHTQAPTSDVTVKVEPQDVPVEYEDHFDQTDRQTDLVVKIEPTDQDTAPEEVMKKQKKRQGPPSPKSILPDIPDYSDPASIDKINGTSSCPVCQKVFSNRGNVQRHLVLHQRETYKCDFCTREYTNKKFFDKHMYLHTLEKKYKCEICNKRFKTVSNLEQHKKSHLEIKPHTCDICQRTFSIRGNMLKHRERHKARPDHFKCPVCNKFFEKEYLLKSHLTRHTDEKPFMCDICCMNFKHKSTLVRHTQIHNGNKPYFCKICYKRFTSFGLIKPHMRTHTGEKPYPCRMCKKPFAHKHNRDRHEVRHSKVKNLVCHICNKKFPRESRLKYHMRSHTKEKPFSCNVCFRNFSHKQNVIRHYDRKHPNVEYGITKNEVKIQEVE